MFENFKNDCPQAVFLYGPLFDETEKLLRHYLEDRASSADQKNLDKPSIDELKALSEFTSIYPEKTYRTITVRNIDKISKVAVNYLLKAIEDSPPYLHWFLFSSTKEVNKALLSRCCVIPVTEMPELKVDESTLNVIKDYASGYKWFLENKDRDDFREALLRACDSLMVHQNDLPKLHLVQKYRNLIKKEVTGFENNFKTLLIQVF